MDLVCGHQQHARHVPPWFNRLWIVSPKGRRSRLGYFLDCKHWDQGAHERAPLREDASFNVSLFIARIHWRMRCVSSATASAKLVQRGEPHCGHLRPRDINVD